MEGEVYFLGILIYKIQTVWILLYKPGTLSPLPVPLGCSLTELAKRHMAGWLLPIALCSLIFNYCSNLTAKAGYQVTDCENDYYVRTYLGDFKGIICLSASTCVLSTLGYNMSPHGCQLEGAQETRETTPGSSHPVSPVQPSCSYLHFTEH
jgi:hypothetical protein